MNYRWSIAFSTAARPVVRKAILGATESAAAPKSIQTLTKELAATKVNQAARMPTFRWAAGATESAAAPARL